MSGGEKETVSSDSQVKEKQGYGADLRDRTKIFALKIIRLYSSLQKGGADQVLGRQLLKSGTSVGAHYREATRARSSAEFVSKIEGGLQELEETSYWLELLFETRGGRKDEIQDLIQEANELTAILVSSVKTAKSRKK